MSKVKLILLIAVIVVIGSLASGLQVYYNKYQKEKADRERLFNNNIELTAVGRQSLALIYTKDEFIRIISDSLKNVLNQLKIRPKEITKIIYRTITDIDTIDRTVFVDYRKTHWMIADTGNCFTWSAMAFLSDTALKVTRTDFSYQNSLPEIHWMPRPHKFLFFRWGKRQVKVRIDPKCGEVIQEKVIDIIKE